MPGGDPSDRGRFVDAQADDYGTALAEVGRGRKTSHRMQSRFPQFDRLGFRPVSRRYPIESAAEAMAYLDHPVLGPRLVENTAAALGVEGRSAREIFGPPDDMKRKSSATLFASNTPPGSFFAGLLDKSFQGGRDGVTLQWLGTASGES